MNWEFERHDWTRTSVLRDARDAVELILCARSREEAEGGYVRLEGSVVSQGAVSWECIPVVEALVAGLPRCAPAGLGPALDVLVQITGGFPASAEVEAGKVDLVEHCRREVALAFPILLCLLQDGDTEEAYAAVDLLGTCAGARRELAPRVGWYLRKARNERPELKLDELIESWLVYVDEWAKNP